MWRTRRPGLPVPQASCQSSGTPAEEARPQAALLRHAQLPASEGRFARQEATGARRVRQRNAAKPAEVPTVSYWLSGSRLLLLGERTKSGSDRPGSPKELS